MSYKGKFNPKNPQKYQGVPSNIIYRSFWEFTCMKSFDEHPDVLRWSSEEMFIQYVSPIDGRIHRYFPDFIVTKKNHSDGNIETVMVEVKPMAQCKPPKVQAKPNKRYLNEVKTWGINSAKWKAAENYCKSRGWKFLIITEKHLGLK